MRPVLHGDVSSAARALLAAPEILRAGLCRRLIREAEAAERYVRKTGQMHPIWGNGSLMAAARRRVLAAEPSFDDRDYCACFEEVLRALTEHRAS
jgi:hypothetical protein